VRSPLYREWDYFCWKFVVGYAPLDEIGERAVQYFFDSGASFVRDFPHRPDHLLIKMIRPPPANAQDFNLVRLYFRSVFILGGFHKLTPKRFYLSLSTKF